jgi:ComF family protein
MIILDSLLHLVFPHVCEGCGTDLISAQHRLCTRCLHQLPQTHFHLIPHNPIEKIFWGRIPVLNATSFCYFSKGSMLQHLMHQFKYKGEKDLGFYLGNLMGHAFKLTSRFASVDALIPLPLYASREKKRGFNQATILCEGIASVLEKPVLSSVVSRVTATETQTHKNRVERWKNMEGRFEVENGGMLDHKHVLLVDDVITTGATLEACGASLLRAASLQLSIATLCFSAH